MGNPFLDAIDVIRERGWGKGRFEREDGRVCLLGAVNVALTGKAYGSAAWQTCRGPLSEAILRIAPHAPISHGEVHIPNWNDQWATEGDIILALKHAAAEFDA